MKSLLSKEEENKRGWRMGHWNTLSMCGHNLCAACVKDFVKLLHEKSTRKGCFYTVREIYYLFKLSINLKGCGYEYEWGLCRRLSVARWNQLVTPFNHPTVEVTESAVVNDNLSRLGRKQLRLINQETIMTTEIKNLELECRKIQARLYLPVFFLIQYFSTYIAKTMIISKPYPKNN